MAQSRLERIGTIFSRISSLMKGGAMKREDRPLWYDICEAFPPQLEPRFDRAAPNIIIKDIYYKEDIIRAKFHKERNKFYTNLNLHSTPSATQKFLTIYNDLKETGVPESEIYEEAVKKWTQQNVNKAEITSSKNEALEQNIAHSTDSKKKSIKIPTIKLADIFQEKNE